jgi:hypothetical protein
MSLFEDKILKLNEVYQAQINNYKLSVELVESNKDNLIELSEKRSQLVEQLSQIETKFNDKYLENNTLENQLNESYQKVQSLAMNGQELIQDTLNEKALQINEKSEEFYSGNFSKVVEDDKDQRIIQAYERNKDIPELEETLRGSYQSALSRIEENQLSSLIVVKDNDELIELYVSVNYDQQEIGLMKNLMVTIADGIVDSGAEDIDGPHDYNGIVKINVSGTDLKSVVDSLQRHVPKDFVESGVSYNVIVNDFFNHKELSDIEVINSKSEEQNNLDSVINDVKETETDKDDTEKQNEPESYKTLGINIADLLKDKETVTVKEAANIIGLRNTALYSPGKYLEHKGGPIKTIFDNNQVSVDVTSLLDFIPETKAYTLTEAANLWKERAEETLGNSNGFLSYRGSLSSRISGGTISTLNHNGKKYIIQNELDCFLTTYFAKKLINNFELDEISRKELAGILNVNPNTITSLVTKSKIFYSKEKRGVYSVDSVKSFLHNHKFVNGKWSTSKRRKNKKND